MSLHGDLLAQAKHLAGNEPRRPKQASLRRAVSAAYYSLFHRLCAEGCLSMFRGSPGRQRERAVLGRCFEHTAMVLCCKTIATGSLPVRMSVFNVSPPISSDLRMVARIFVEMQEERHRADDDTAAVFHRADVFQLVQNAVDATEASKRIRNTDEAASFSLCLLFWKTLKDR